MARENTSGGRDKVVALPQAELPGLAVATTCGLGNTIHGSRNEIWLCPAYAADAQTVMVYVKLGLGTRAMLAEALCAQIAHCLDLETPVPYLVTVAPHHVGRERGGRAVLAFGAEDLSERAMARPVRSLDMLLDLLRKRKVEDLVSVFDEWIANDVRSPSDILVSPEARLYLIDHEAALGPTVGPADAVTNWLVGQLLAGLETRERALFLRRLRGRLAALHRVSLAEPPLAVGFAQDGVALYRALLQFLRERLVHMDRLISQRVLPEQGYIQEQPASDDPATDATG